MLDDDDDDDDDDNNDDDDDDDNDDDVDVDDDDDVDAWSSVCGTVSSMALSQDMASARLNAWSCSMGGMPGGAGTLMPALASVAMSVVSLSNSESSCDEH